MSDLEIAAVDRQIRGCQPVPILGVNIRPVVQGDPNRDKILCDHGGEKALRRVGDLRPRRLLCTDGRRNEYRDGERNGKPAGVQFPQSLETQHGYAKAS